MAQVHVITNPAEGGINVNAHDARIAHFSHLVGGNAPGGTCGLPLPSDWWFRDGHVGKMARRVRKCISNQTVQEVRVRQRQSNLDGGGGRRGVP